MCMNIYKKLFMCTYMHVYIYIYSYITGSHFLKKDIQDRNPKKAVSLLENSCNANHAPSCFNLAVLFKKGDICTYMYMYMYVCICIYKDTYIYIDMYICE
jgi:hypothetical protein